MRRSSCGRSKLSRRAGPRYTTPLRAAAQAAWRRAAMPGGAAPDRGVPMAESEIPTCAPHDPNPRRPRLQAPPGACDCHAHVFGPAARHPYSPKRGYTPPDASFEAYRHMHAVLGIARGVLTQPSVYGTDNRAMLDAVARDPGQLRAVAAVDADVTEDELRRLDEAGVRGVRVNLVDPGGMP